MKTQLLTFAMAAALSTHAVPLLANGNSKDPGVAPVSDSLYAQECSACHFAYQPGLMPARSWQQMMADLENHFGENAELEAVDQQALTNYLVHNAADDSKYKRSVKIMRSLSKDQTPLRITEIPYMVQKHDKLLPKMVVGNPSVKSLSYCEKCHTRADTGYYSERDIVIPGYESWKDDDHSSKKGDDHSSEKDDDHSSKKGDGHSSEKDDDHSSKKGDDHSSKKDDDHSSKKGDGAILQSSNQSVSATEAVDQLLKKYQSEGAGAFSKEAGKALWTQEFTHEKSDGKIRQCSACHTDDLRNVGKQVRTGKSIKPLAPSVNPKSLTSMKKIHKWLKRNCKWTIGRECSAQEKGDVLTFIQSQ